MHLQSGTSEWQSPRKGSLSPQIQQMNLASLLAMLRIDLRHVPWPRKKSVQRIWLDYFQLTLWGCVGFWVSCFSSFIRSSLYLRQNSSSSSSSMSSCFYILFVIRSRSLFLLMTPLTSSSSSLTLFIVGICLSRNASAFNRSIWSLETDTLDPSQMSN